MVTVPGVTGVTTKGPAGAIGFDGSIVESVSGFGATGLTTNGPAGAIGVDGSTIESVPKPGELSVVEFGAW